MGVRHYRIHPSKKRTWAPSSRLELIQTNSPPTQFRVTNLHEDRTYQFRFATKKLGHSPWLWSRIYRPELTFDPSVKPDIPTVSHVTRVQVFSNWMDQNQIGSRVLCFRNQKLFTKNKCFKRCKHLGMNIPYPGYLDLEKLRFMFQFLDGFVHDSKDWTPFEHISYQISCPLQYDYKMGTDNRHTALIIDIRLRIGYDSYL